MTNRYPLHPGQTHAEPYYCTIPLEEYENLKDEISHLRSLNETMRADGSWALPIPPTGDTETPIYIDSNGASQPCGALLRSKFHYWIRTFDNTGSGEKCDLNSRLAATDGTYLVLVFNNASTYAEYNAPQSGWIQVETCYHVGTSSYATQIAKAYTGDMYYRGKDNNTWGAWKKLT